MPLFCFWISTIIKMEFNLKICGVWIHCWPLRWSVLCSFVTQCWVLDTWSKQIPHVSLPRYTISNSQRWDCQSSQIICFPNKISKYPKMLKLKLPPSTFTSHNQHFWKGPIDLGSLFEHGWTVLEQFFQWIRHKQACVIGHTCSFFLSLLSP